MNIQDVIAVVNSQAAMSLALSKGGWEGWLQCELWRYLTIHKNESPEREVPYPAPYQNTRCDLVGADDNQSPLWVEIKAYGIFRSGDDNRFLDGIALDVQKLGSKPTGAIGIALVVVPKAIEEPFKKALAQRGWNNFRVEEAEYVSVFYMEI